MSYTTSSSSSSLEQVFSSKMEQLIELFQSYNWLVGNKGVNNITFIHPNHYGKEFILGSNENSQSSMFVSFPLKTTVDYNFRTSFDNYSELFDFVVDKLNYMNE